MNARSRDKERQPIGMADEQSHPVTSAPVPGMQSTRGNATPEVQVSQPVEAPMLADEKAPVTPVQRRGPVQAEPQAVQSTETPQKKPYTWWWQTPDFVGAVESQAKAAEKRAEQDRKRARRERNAAILGDLAKLGAQMYAKSGGAWKIDPFTPATEKANDKLAALRERHAAEVAAFARQRAAAKQAQIADNNARMKLEASLAEADAERKRREKEREEDVAFRNLRAAAQDDMDQKNYELRVKEHNRVLAQQGKPGQYLAYDRYGNERWFDSEQSAETFSRNEETWYEEEYDEVTKEDYVDVRGNSQIKTISRKKKDKGYSKKPKRKIARNNDNVDITI